MSIDLTHLNTGEILAAFFVLAVGLFLIISGLLGIVKILRGK